MKYLLFIFIPISALLLHGCFEEDRQLEPYESPYTVVALEESVYTHQLYVDLGSGEVVASNRNEDWVLAFECGAGGCQVRLNSSDLWEMAPSGTTDFDAVEWDGMFNWRSDGSDGNPDSVVTANWVIAGDTGNVYSHEVYMLGHYDGIGYTDIKKIQLLHVDSLVYRIAVDSPDSPAPDTFTVPKQEGVNYVQFSPETGETVSLEPPRDQWDLLFCQYKSILFTDDGIPTPYYVRGALLNPYQVAACLDTLHGFDAIDEALASGFTFSEQQDIIGYDWKSVTVDEGTNSAVYAVREGYTYLVRDMGGKSYKLRFISYLGSTGVKGYPSFELTELEP